MQRTKDFSKALHEYRMRRELTLEELSILAGVPLTTIHSIIKGRRNPSELTRRKILNRIPQLFEGAA